jgi:putative addiction module CopG family antidote
MTHSSAVREISKLSRHLRECLTLPFLPPNLVTMKVRLTPDQEVFVRRTIESGGYETAEEAVKAALLLWEAREVKRMEFLATLDDARASLARGEGLVLTRESARELSRDVKHRGQTRITAEQAQIR